MNEGFRRFVVLGAVFLLAFVAVFAFRRIQNGEGLFDFLKFGKEEEQQFVPEEYTLRSESALKPGEVPGLVSLDEEYAKLTAAVVPSVVSLHTEGMGRELFRDLLGRLYERKYPVKGIGSGVIVTKQGHVITNQHVTDGKTEISVTMHDGKTYPAIVIGEDKALDIAVIRIKRDGDRPFVPLKFGDSDRVRQGQHAFAVGNPFGLGETVTKGIISAKERSFSDKDPDYFQTDAAINPGNSGGPLVNILGDVIAINVAIYSPDTIHQGSVGVGFSIPSNDVWEVFEQIVTRGRPVRGWLGVQSYNWAPIWREHSGYKGEKGAFIYDVVSNSPADKAGLLPSDVVLRYDGTEVENRLHFFSLIQRTKVGKKVPLDVFRKGKKVTLNADVIDSEEADAVVKEEPTSRTANDREVLRKIGVQVQRLTVRQRKAGIKGVRIAEVVPGSQADEHNLRPGDFILAINNVTTDSPGSFYARLIASAAVQPTTVILQRGQRKYEIKFAQVQREVE